jgi:Superinfection immunity protein
MTLSALGREHETVGGIFVVNLFLGWTFIGWVVALSWAMSKPKQHEAFD